MRQQKRQGGGLALNQTVYSYNMSFVHLITEEQLQDRNETYHDDGERRDDFVGKRVELADTSPQLGACYILVWASSNSARGNDQIRAKVTEQQWALLQRFVSGLPTTT